MLSILIALELVSRFDAPLSLVGPPSPIEEASEEASAFFIGFHPRLVSRMLADAKAASGTTRTAAGHAARRFCFVAMDSRIGFKSDLCKFFGILSDCRNFD